MNTLPKHWLIAAKDLRELVTNRIVVLPMIIVPAVLCVALPLVLLVVGLKSDILLIQAAQLIEGVLHAYPVPAEFVTVPERVLYVFLNYTMLGLFMVIPIMVSSIIAAHAIAGEKERRTLETLLYTPITNRQFFIGKLLSAFLPALTISILSFVLYFATANLLFFVLRGVMVIRSWIWLPGILLLTPAVSLLGLGGTLLVSLRSKTFMQAQQASAFIVLPCIMYIGLQISGVIVFSPPVVALLGAVLLAADYLIIASVGPRFERERIISSL
jgi:ABC-2 type transport system permease protein